MNTNIWDEDYSSNEDDNADYELEVDEPFNSESFDYLTRSRNCTGTYFNIFMMMSPMFSHCNRDNVWHENFLHWSEISR